MPAKRAPKSGTTGGSSSDPVQHYLQQSRRPLVSLAFVVPLLVLYEGGIVILGPQAVRNGADVWLRQFLDSLGFSQYFLLPALTVGLLLAWHHVAHERWQVSAGVLYTMLLECAVLGVGLVLLARVQGLLVASALEGVTHAPREQLEVPWVMAGRGAFLGRMLGYLGAGIYEELLFRLMLVPPLVAAAARFCTHPGTRVAGVVIITSLVFSAAHYIGPHGESLDAFTALFRFTAGAIFAVLFVYRGFGIAAGTHALYDIFVSLA